MARLKFEGIDQNLNFSKNAKDNKSYNGYKFRSFINHFNQLSSNSVSNDDSRTIEQYMVKFKGQSNIKKYIKNKRIKWGFNFCYRFTREIGYPYQFDLYLGKKESSEENLAPNFFHQILFRVFRKRLNSFKMVTVWAYLIISSIVLHIQGSYMREVCMVLALVEKIGKEGFDRKVKKSDFEYLYPN